MAGAVTRWRVWTRAGVELPRFLGPAGAGLDWAYRVAVARWGAGVYVVQDVPDAGTGG